MKIINLTPHPISLASLAGEIIQTIEPSGQIARVSTISVDAGYFVCGLPVVRNTIGEVQNLPPSQEGTAYIVSLFVLSAVVSDRLDVVAPDTGPTCVRDSQGRILAVRQFLAA